MKPLTQKERLEVFEKVFHGIHFARLYNPSKVIEYLNLIDAWSFASNASNGAASWTEVRRKKDNILREMKGL